MATTLIAASGALYGWYLTDPGVAVVGSTRLTGLALFVLGVGACAAGADAFETPGLYAKAMSWAGTAGTALAITVLITGHAAALAALAALMALLWLVATGRHAAGVHISTQPAAGLPRIARPQPR